MDMKIIAHIDMDAFFAAVEERDKPWLAGMPIVVGADPEGGYGRGVVSTANYAARKYGGIGSAMPISRAWQLSEQARKEWKPQVMFLTPNLSRYEETSARIMKIVAKYARVVEQTSIDEAYLDMSRYRSYKKAREAGENLKKEIRKKERLTASVGIGPNKMVAKIASDIQKPDGLAVVLPARVVEFLAPLSVRKIHGIGPKTEKELARAGIHTIADLQAMPVKRLAFLFGENGKEYYDRARGYGTDELSAEHERKSIGEQETFHNDVSDMKELLRHLEGVASRVFARFLKSEFKSFRTVVLTVRFADFETVTRSYTAREALSKKDELTLHSTRLLMPFFDRRGNPQKKATRLLGVRIEKIA